MNNAKQPKTDDVLRRMLATKPDPHVQPKPKKKPAKKRAK